MSELYGKNEELGKDKVEQTEGAQSPGDYLAVIGRTYANKNDKSGSTAKVTDFFLCNRTGTNASMNYEIMKIVVKGGKQTLEFKIGNDQKLIIGGTLFKHFNVDPTEKHSAGAKNFFATTRKKFARALGAFDEATSIIDWTKIQKLAGRFVTFSLKENGDYMNIDPKSMALMETGSVTTDNLKALYEVYEAEIAKRRSMTSAPTTATAAPEDLLKQVPPSEKNDDPLPF